MENQQKRPIFTIICFASLIAFRLIFFLAFSITGAAFKMGMSEIIELVILITLVISLIKNKKNITLLAMGVFALWFLFSFFRINFAHPVKAVIFKTVAFDLSSFLIWAILAIFILIDISHNFEKLKSKKDLFNKIFLVVFVVYCILCLVSLHEGFSSDYYQMVFGSEYDNDFQDLLFELFESPSLYRVVLDNFAYIFYAIAFVSLKMWIYPTSNKFLRFINKLFKKTTKAIDNFISTED